ncbi:MAG: response regulator transcription factor [Gammaproteobacteria bacterium]
MDKFVFIVDDDLTVLEATEMLVKSMGFSARTFVSAIEFLEAYESDWRGCLILDVRMPAMSGIDLQAELNQRGCSLPIIFITGHGDVPLAVRAMQAGAIDFLEKPYNDQRLLDDINKAFEMEEASHSKHEEVAAIHEKLSTLTPRESEVMARVVAGEANKVIAAELGLSERTVEIHRSRVMSKMKCRSVAELVTMANRA